MPPLPESDDYSNMTEGKFVYWMRQDEDIPRGELGKIVEADDAKPKVRFSNGKFRLKAKQLNVSDFQVGTFVIVCGDNEDMDAFGEIKDLEDGKLKVEIKGEEHWYKPQKLVKCDFQPGMFVFWIKSDDDIPPGHIGELLRDLNDKGRCKVRFPNGSWRFKPSQMIRAHVQPNSYVQWIKSDEDIQKGEVGQVIGDLNDKGRMKVQFVKGAWRFKPEDLFLSEFQYGSFVTWEKHDEDIAKGDLGQVVALKADQGRLKVQFPKGTWSFKINELRFYHIQPGQWVCWKREDDDIPRGSIGEVVRMKDEKNRISVMWPKSGWSIKPKDLRLAPLQKSDRVQWVKADDDIPQGDIGQVSAICYTDDEETSGKRVIASFTKGSFNFAPETLKPLNLDADDINGLKTTFKKFDQNGDGKLSEEELVKVLCKIGEEGQEGGLSEEECKELFQALDKDGNGKLTTDEFIEYIFGGDAKGSVKKMLGDGFGLDSIVGMEDEDGEDDDDDPSNEGPGSSQVIVAPTKPVVIVNVEDVESIDGETTASREEWATAMLSLGICRQASLESFDACLADLGQEEDPPLKHLAAELNGLNGAPGVEELRDAVGKVKHGKLDMLDLSTPAAEVEQEVELAKKTGIEGLVFHLHVQDKELQTAPDEIGAAKLSALETEVLSGMGGDDLVAAVEEASKSPPVVSAMASMQRAREHCRREVQEIIESCGEDKYTDSSWNPIEDQNAVLYVDKSAPGWDCTVRLPGGWERATEIRDDPKLIIDGQEANDVEQGSTGDCYLLGAVAAMASNRKRFVRQAFPAYDIGVGVYGVLFCKEAHYTYEIIDDYLAHRSRKTDIIYGESSNRQELWVSMLEKAFFKHYTCIEMCDGGHGPEAMFSFLGGVHGQYDIGDDEFKNPSSFFEKTKLALEAGELMTTGFTEPSKGKYAEMGGGEEGQCGEKGLPFGLHGGHCYSVLTAKEALGKQLLQIRNPWGHGEWKGPFSDKSEEWTDELKEAFGLQDKKDGTFWMAAEDYVQLSTKVRFNRTFGPAWQTTAIFRRWDKDHPKARAKKAYQACEDSEISFKKGELVEVLETQGYWCKGRHLKTGEEGYFRSKDVEMQCVSVFKYEFSVADVADGAPIILAVIRENQKMCREFSVRKGTELNYKDKNYPRGYMFVFDAQGKRILRQSIGRRHTWTYLDATKGPWTIYCTCPGGQGKRFGVHGFAPHGSMEIHNIDCTYNDFIDACS